MANVFCDERMPTRPKSLVYKTAVCLVVLMVPNAGLQPKRQISSPCDGNENATLGFTCFDRIRNTTVRQEMEEKPITAMRENRLWWYGHVLWVNTSTCE